MKFRAVYLSVFVSCAASTAAGAASNDHPKDLNHPTSREGWSERCASLDAQFDGLIEKYTGTPNFEAASALHANGVSDCASSDQNTGASKLEEAIRKLGVEPKI